ncbi:MAG: class I SAM-dependent methyltransferase [Fluviicola sp.]|nr:class I SAM-dependent methyltransferase [Fluviicola sp.]
MSNNLRKDHWENIYQTKQLKDVSWYQPVPETSLDFLQQFDLPKTAKIIDVGGGDSLFVDYLLDLGYTDVSVLDISENALERAKERLGAKAQLVKWIVSDVSTFEPSEQYDFWHDRAVFHFLTEKQDIENYMTVLSKGVQTDGILVMGTFSESGPTKCSGIPIKQYSEKSMKELLATAFDKIRCLRVDHKTPFDTIQQFVFCGFKKRPFQLN